MLTLSPVLNFDDYAAYIPDPKKLDNDYKQGHLFATHLSAMEVKKQLDRIRGHLVWMPLDFLKDAEMAEKGLQVNAYTESIYT